jgi:hypothetical protein
MNSTSTPMPPSASQISATDKATLLAYLAAPGGSGAATAGTTASGGVAAPVGSGGCTSGQTAGGTTTAGSTAGATAGNTTVNPSNTGGSWTPGPGLEACNAQGLEWVAVTANGGPGACGANKLAAWCCTEAEAAKQLPTYAAAISATTFPGTTTPKGSYKLYNCSNSSDGKTYLDYAYMDGSGIHYFTEWIPAQSNNASTGQCTVLTSADLGITASTSTPATGTTTGTATGGTTAGTTVPTGIGAYFTDASANGILTKLQSDLNGTTGYKTWQTYPVHTSAAHNGALVRNYYNATVMQNFSAAAAGTSYPVGAIAIKELLNGTTLAVDGWFVLGKGIAGDGASTWLTYEIAKVNGAFPASPQVFGMGDGGCASSSCHGGAHDMIKSDNQ